MGLWSTCMPVGNIVVLNLAPRLAEQYSWNLVWKMGAGFGLAAFVLFWMFFRMPRPGEGIEESLSTEERLGGGKTGLWKVMANTSLWLITVQFFCYNLVCLALGFAVVRALLRKVTAVRVALDEGGLTGKITPETTFEEGDFRASYFRDDRKQQVFDRVQRIVGDLGISLDQLPETALRFVLSHPAVSTVIPGMRSVRNVERNCQLGDGHGFMRDGEESSSSDRNHEANVKARDDAWKRWKDLLKKI